MADRCAGSPGRLCDRRPRQSPGQVAAEHRLQPSPGTACRRCWWTGLDSNQRTLARADLQSAAFNHSATCPDVGRRAKWRAQAGVSTCLRPHSAGLCPGCKVAAGRWPSSPIFKPDPGMSENGAGNGNRTRVFSLEGCCTTIVLYPRLDGGLCHCTPAPVNGPPGGRRAGQSPTRPATP
jgi:hypothetical protein